MVRHMLISTTLLVLAITANAGNVLLNAGGNHLPPIGWRCDTGAYVNSGSKYTSNRKVTVPGSWGPVYQSHRWVSTGDLEYKIPVPDGIYTIFLIWAETWTGSGLGVRQFTVKINGELQAQSGKFDGTLDVWKAAGGLDKPYFFNAGKKASKNGFITITLGRIPGKNNPMLSGAAIFGTNADELIGAEGAGSCSGGSPTPTSSPTTTPTAPPTTTPTVSKSPGPSPEEGDDCSCGEATVTTGKINNGAGFVMNVGGPAAANIGFGADNIKYIEEADIGLVAKAPVPVIDSGKWGEPHQTHRYTKGSTLTYKIPVPAGNYHIGLLFTESFMNAPGQRTFDILINNDLKANEFDVFKANGGKNKPGYKGFNGIASVDGFIKIQFKKVTENPFINGMFIKGEGAGSLAIGGPDIGPCTKKCQKADPCKNQVIGTDFNGTHAAHAVAGGPYVVTDFEKKEVVQVNLDGTLSHTHFTEGERNALVTKWEWRWKEPSNPLADKATGIVTAYGPKVTANFPLGTTAVTLKVVDDFCYAAEETTTVTVKSATIPGAYCYYYDLGMQNPATVPLPINVKLDPKPMKGLNVGDINFANTKSFGDFDFMSNAFAVRCQFFLDVKTAGELQYKVIHSGPVKVYHAGTLVGSSDSKAANQMTITKKEATIPGLQEWQVLYLKPQETDGKLIFQFSDGQVIPPSTIRHDSSATLPVIVSLSKTNGAPEQLLKIFGTAFVNGVKVKFGNKDAIPLEGNAGSIEIRAPPGFASGTTVPVTVTTNAGVSNAINFKYKTVVTPPLKFKEDFVKNLDGTPYLQNNIAVIKYGPDGRLYCGATNSKIYALTLDKDLKVTKKCVKNVFEKYPRQVLGLGFDRKTDDLKLFFTTSTHSFGKKNLVPNGWENGKVKSVTMEGPTGCFNDDVTDVVTGLPVADHDHGVQAIEFLPNGKMLIAVGGVTNGGLPHPTFGDLAGNPLSGAIVECPSTGTDMIYSSVDPGKAKIIGGSCKVYAAGFRNTFAMSYFTNNKLYATDNGPNGENGNFATDCIGGEKPNQDLKDKLFLVEPDKCHGHPNLNRGLNGFPDECVFENPKCVQPLRSDLESSINGIIEYRSNIFGIEAKGNMFLTQHPTAQNEGLVSRVILDQYGKIEPNGFTEKFYPKSGLSVVEGPRGEIIMGRVYAGSDGKTFIVLKPDYTKPTITVFISVMPRRGPAEGGTKILVTGHNFGSAPSAKFGMKDCTDVTVIDDDSFTCVTPPGSEDTQVKVEVTGSTGVAMGPGFDYWYF